MEPEQKDVRRARAWIVVQDERQRHVLADLSRLANLRPILIEPAGAKERRRGVEAGDVLLVGPDLPVSSVLGGLRKITVGGRYQLGSDDSPVDITIPGDEVALLHLLSGPLEGSASERGSADSGRVLLVGAWNGGGGATTTAQRLARASKAVLIDAAGNRGGSIALEDAAAWDDLVVSDLPSPWRLVASLPRIDGIPTLTTRLRRPLQPNDLEVGAVVTALSRAAVVDCGVHLDALFDLQEELEAQGKLVTVLLTGSGCEKGAAALGRWCAQHKSQDAPQLLLSTRAHAMFHAVAERYGLRWSRAPRPSSGRGWQRTKERVWA